MADFIQNLFNIKIIMNFINNLINFNNNIVSFFKYIASGLLVFIGLLIFVDIILREGFNRTIIGVPEIVANFVVIIAFMQFAYSISVKGMLRSDLFLNIMPKSISIYFDTLAHCLGILFFALLAWASYDSMIQSFLSSEFEGHTEFQFPTLPVKSTIFIFSCFSSFTYVLCAIKDIADYKFLENNN